MPQEDTSVIILASTPAILITNTDKPPPFEKAISQIDEGGVHRLYSLGDSQKAQLLQLAPESSDVPLAAIVPLDITGFDRLEAVGRLLAAVHSLSLIHI